MRLRALSFTLFIALKVFSQKPADQFCYQLQRMLSAGMYDNFELLTITSDRKSILDATPDLSVTLPGFEKCYVDKDNYCIAILPLYTDSLTAADSLYNVWLHTSACLPAWQSMQVPMRELTAFLKGCGTGYQLENKQFTIRIALIKKEKERFVVAMIAKRKK